jgi:hypothetical protein
MADILSSPKSMLRRAEQQIRDLEGEIEHFMQEKPWSNVVEKDANGIDNVHKVRFTARLSEDLSHIIFEAANNLRAALDQIGFAVATAAGKSDPKSCKFPMGPTEADMRNNAKGGCKDLPTDVVTLFESFKPYKGGNDALWALNELANGPKHKLLKPVAVGGAAFSIKSGVFSGSAAIPFPEWDREKNEIIFLRTKDGTQVEYNANVAFSVTLDDVHEILRGKDPAAALRAMAREVAEVINLTETSCKAIGLIK